MEKFDKCLRHEHELLWRIAMKTPLQDKEVTSLLALMSVLIKTLIVDSKWYTTRPDIAEVYLEYFRGLPLSLTSVLLISHRKAISNRVD